MSPFPFFSLASRWRGGVLVSLALSFGCGGGTLDAGRNVPRGPLPVDNRNPVILDNDSCSDNWFGEYALLFAATDGPPLAGFVVSGSQYWPDPKANANKCMELVSAARASGMANIPDITTSQGGPLSRPDSGVIADTVPNHSAGAQLMVTRSRELSVPGRPVVVAIANRLTDLADAYLMDPGIVDRVVVLAMLGTPANNGATMAGPNGDLDPWSDWIVNANYRYIQVSAYYDQTGDVTQARIPDLPKNPFGKWMANKQSGIFTITTASDQVAILPLGLASFSQSVVRVSGATAQGFSMDHGPDQVHDPKGASWLIETIATPLAASRLWQMLYAVFPSK